MLSNHLLTNDRSHLRRQYFVRHCPSCRFQQDAQLILKKRITNKSNVGGKVNTGIEIKYVSNNNIDFETQTYVPPLSTRVLQSRFVDANTASDPLQPKLPSYTTQKDDPAKGLGAKACVLPFTAADDSKVGRV